MTHRIALTFALLAVAGCSKGKPSAMSVCQKIQAAGIGSDCHDDKPGGLGAAAVERAEFKLTSVPGKGGMVLRFDRESFYDSTEEAFGKAAMLAGPHRYGSRKALIFVHLDEGLDIEKGRAVKAIVDGL